MNTATIRRAAVVGLTVLVPGGGVVGAPVQDGDRGDVIALRDTVLETAQRATGGVDAPAAGLPSVLDGLRLESPVLHGVPGVTALVDPGAAALDRCTSAPPPGGPYGTVRAALNTPDDEALRARLEVLHDSLEVAGAAHPHDVETLYLSAVVMGARSEMASGRDKLRWGEAMYHRSQSVLELDPDHAGTRHLVGRVHAAVRRMSGFKRFVAKSLFGGDVLGEASWESARSNLEAAEAGAPCVADHHYELARLYVERGEPELALREIRHVARLTRSVAEDEAMLEKARLLLVELEGGGG